MTTNVFSQRSTAGRGARLVAVLTLSALLAGCAGLGSPGTGQPRAGGSLPGKTATLDPQQTQRLQQIMTPLVQHMSRPVPLSQVRVHLLDSPDINAANAGGGEFYVTTGLLQRANDDELRGVLAHEIAHDDLGHVGKTQALGTGLSIGTIILDQILPGSGTITPYIADLGVLKPYSRNEEYEADSHAVDILNHAGYNGKAIMAGTLNWILKSSGPSGGFFATHPGTEDRIARINKMG